MKIKKEFEEYAQASHYWLTNKWKDRMHDFSWLIEKFWPLPMEDTKMRNEKYIWPENWREYYERLHYYGSQRKE